MTEHLTLLLFIGFAFWSCALTSDDALRQQENFIKNQTSHSFEKDQFVILKDKSISKTFNTINNFFNQHKFIRNSYEKVWVGENHVQGKIKKINYKLFKEINKYFVCELKDVFMNFPPKLSTCSSTSARTS